MVAWKIILFPIFISFGKTAFHIACIYGQKRIVEIMIDKADSKEIDLSARDTFGRTTFSIAEDYKSYSIANLIREKLPSLTF